MKLIRPITRHRHFIFILGILVLVVCIISQLVIDWVIHQEATTAVASQPVIVSLIDDAVNNLVSPAPVNAQTGQVYFPDAKLVLPQPSQDFSVREIEYTNITFNNSFALQVTSKSIVALAETKLLTAYANAQSSSATNSKALQAVYNQVPNLQACARGVQLFYTAQQGRSSLTLQFTKKLNSGKTLYAYTEPTCSSQQLPVLVDYLKQIQSY